MMMRTISELNVPGYIAPPHFMPEVDSKSASTAASVPDPVPWEPGLSIPREKHAPLNQ